MKPAQLSWLTLTLTLTALTACGGGGGAGSDVPTLNFSPSTAQLQGGWVTCDPTFDASGNPSGSEQEVLNFNLNPAGGEVSMSIVDSTYNSTDCSGTPASTSPSVSLGLTVQGASLLPDGTLIEKASLSGAGRFSGKQVLKISSRQLSFGDKSKPLDANGYPTALEKRVYNKR
jgi:hypothetical protein